MPETTDDMLLEAARGGDDEALERLLERHQARVYRFGMKMCRNPDDAEDVLQDTLLAMARGVRDFRGASSLSTWLYSIARSFCIKKRRRSRFAPATESSIDCDDDREAGALVDPGVSPEEAAARHEVGQALEAAIARLEPKYREVLILRDAEGLTAPEVAEVLGLGVDAVKSRLHRARRSVRDRLAPLLAPAGDPAPAAGASCPDVLAMFSRHLEGEISADVCASMERHLEGCPRCRGACDSLKETRTLCATADASLEVPAAVQRSVKAAFRSFLAEKKT